MSKYLRYRIVARKSVYDVSRNKVIATFDDPEDADQYLHWVRVAADIKEAVERSNDYWRERYLTLMEKRT